MTCGDLFAGIGGMSLGLERAGFAVRWQVEREPYCENVLARHWPHVARRRDVRFAGAGTLEPVDLIAGGFPCQDVSTAGKGAGIEAGHRSGLWREFARIVRELSPRWVLVENVPAVRRRGADLVLGDLEAAGYACWPLVVGARHVGAPHRRDRVWIVGRLAVDSGQQERATRRAAMTSEEELELLHRIAVALERIAENLDTTLYGGTIEDAVGLADAVLRAGAER
jgi:DNA (cytosine-5)-methyltransferase 1